MPTAEMNGNLESNNNVDDESQVFAASESQVPSHKNM